MELPPENDVCSICHANFHIPCQANCSHWFCGSCILQVWDYGAALHPCKCPLCRREITLLVPSEASPRRQQMADFAEILLRIERYNRLYGERTNGLMQKYESCNLNGHFEMVDDTNPFLAENARPPFSSQEIVTGYDGSTKIITAYNQGAGLFGTLDKHDKDLDLGPLNVTSVNYNCEMSLGGWYCHMVVGVIYVLSPVDLVPEGLLGIFGLLDDLIIVFICFLYVAALYRAVLLNRHGGT
ncbi:hypothetical protein BUALT_Bualt08G0143100 [Buddleja alternifolia]|uniref:E3 ubiquitin-protein ligase RNF170 n=1 Tax=Buddleja alternifolia TaxID=168488 RepID=A0AAV6XHF0_9LAMI|nr:hypothetical protein BUALT_Bualt08G0143100 [Buddleja alternifolia]